MFYLEGFSTSVVARNISPISLTFWGPWKWWTDGGRFSGVFWKETVSAQNLQWPWITRTHCKFQEIWGSPMFHLKFSYSKMQWWTIFSPLIAATFHMERFSDQETAFQPGSSAGETSKSFKADDQRAALAKAANVAFNGAGSWKALRCRFANCHLCSFPGRTSLLG